MPYTIGYSGFAPANHWGVLVCGRPCKIDFKKALQNEVAETEARLKRFMHSADPTTMCKAVKQLRRGNRHVWAYTWRKAVR